MKPTRFLSVLAAFVIAGCGGVDIHPVFDQPVVTLEQACEKHADFCANYTADSMCRAERRDFLEGYYYFTEERTGKNAFRMMMITKTYSDCAGKAKHIEYVPVEQKYPDPDSMMTAEKRAERDSYAQRIARLKSGKIENHTNAMAFLRYLEKEYDGYQNPELLAYRWQNQMDDEAKSTLIKMFNERQIDSLEIRFLVTGTFSRNNTSRAIDELLALLEEYPPSHYLNKDEAETDPTMKLIYGDMGALHLEVFKSLTSLYFATKDYNKSFLFASLLHINGEKIADREMIAKYIQQNSTNSEEILSQLQDVAEIVDSSLEDGAFNRHLLKI